MNEKRKLVSANEVMPQANGPLVRSTPSACDCSRSGFQSRTSSQINLQIASCGNLRTISGCDERKVGELNPHQKRVEWCRSPESNRGHTDFQSVFPLSDFDKIEPWRLAL